MTWKKPAIKHNKLTTYNWLVSHPENLELGYNTDIGAFTYIQAEYGVIIKDNVQIGSHCSIYSKNTIDNTYGKIIIEENAKIGSHTVILPIHKCELIIGENSKIGAHSLVKHHILKNTTWVGIPAKEVLEYKFEGEV